MYKLRECLVIVYNVLACKGMLQGWVKGPLKHKQAVL
jgi:hypothetical protein